MTQLPQFSFKLLQPRYWPTWLALSFVYLIVLLPYPLIYRLGQLLGRFLPKLVLKQKAIAHRTIQLCFPDMAVVEQEQLLTRYFQSAGMGFFETGMAWFWPDWRLKRWSRVKGLEHFMHAQKQGQGILLIGIHFFTLELGARILGIHYSGGVGVFRPNKNKVVAWVQKKGRLRSNNQLIDRKNVKAMFLALRRGNILWYAPDQDYRAKSSIFVPFFGVKDTATTLGSYKLIRSCNPAVIPFTPLRRANGKGYEITILPAVTDLPLHSAVETTAQINRVIEQCILKAPEQYIWAHPRFRTRPEGHSSLY